MAIWISVERKMFTCIILHFKYNFCPELNSRAVKQNRTETLFHPGLYRHTRIRTLTMTWWIQQNNMVIESRNILMLTFKFKYYFL